VGDQPHLHPQQVVLLRRYFGASRLRVLDLGCGRGRGVRALEQLGHDAWGADISEREIRAAEGPHPERFLLMRGGCVPASDGSFDVIITSEVLEHVNDLDMFASEVARLLRPGGVSIHSFPAKWRLIEPHFNAPLIHWLPKNRLRWYALYLLQRTRPLHPPEIPAEASVRTVVDFEYEYSNLETFYRPHRRITRAFAQHGLSVASVSGEHAKIPLGRGSRVADWLVRTFAREMLVASKPSAG